MVPFEALTEKEKEAIIHYIDNYAEDDMVSYRVSCSIEHLLRFWNQNKESLFHLFGDKLILEKEVQIQRPKDMMVYDIENNLLNYSQQFYAEFQRNFNRMIYSYQLTSNILSLIDSEMLITNIYDGPDFEIPVEDERRHPIQVHNGCKVMKVLGKIAAAFDIKGFEEFRLAHSLILNQKSMTGTLCLSIHPLDYMTMSDNECDWESCMSWWNDGEFRQGTVEMMNSKYVIVAYLKAAQDMSLGYSYTWSNKRWRELMIVHDELLLEVRQYPFHDDALGDVVFDWVKSLLPKDAYEDEFFTLRNATEFKREDGSKFYVSITTDMMYNDVYGKRRAYLAKNGVFKDPEQEGFWLNYSGESECMTCGKGGYRVVSDEGDLICEDCMGPSYYCEHCNYATSEPVFLDSGEVLCPECARTEAGQCDGCTGLFYKDELTHIDSFCYCESCLRQYKLISFQQERKK